MKTRECIRDTSVTMFHIDDGEVVAGESGDLSEGWRETEEENAVEGFAIFQASFEGVCHFGGSGGGGDGGRRSAW